MELSLYKNNKYIILYIKPQYEKDCQEEIERLFKWANQKRGVGDNTDNMIMSNNKLLPDISSSKNKKNTNKPNNNKISEKEENINNMKLFLGRDPIVEKMELEHLQHSLSSSKPFRDGQNNQNNNNGNNNNGDDNDNETIDTFQTEEENEQDSSQSKEVFSKGSMNYMQLNKFKLRTSGWHRRERDPWQTEPEVRRRLTPICLYSS